MISSAVDTKDIMSAYDEYANARARVILLNNALDSDRIKLSEGEITHREYLKSVERVSEQSIISNRLERKLLELAEHDANCKVVKNWIK